jgi:Flp pilus assembly protein TadD
MPTAVTIALAVLVAAATGSAAPAPAVEAPRRVSARAVASYLEGRRLERAGDLAGAADAFRTAVAHDEGSAEVRVAYATALAEVGRLDSAEGEARRALDLAPRGRSASEAHVLLARIAAARSRPREARLALGRAVRAERALAEEGGEVDPTPWRLLAELRAAAGDDDGAADVLEELARHAPGDGSGFRELGRAALERRDAARAERHLGRALGLDRRDVEALRLRAAANAALGRVREAKDDHLAILEVEPEEGASLLALGRIALDAGDLESARAWFGRFTRGAEDPPEAHVRVVFHWLEASRAAEALAAARGAVGEVGPDPRLRFAEGIALGSLGRHAEAIAPLQAVPPSASAYFVPARVALSGALSRAGRHREAERALAEPLALRPGDVRVVVARAAALEREGRARDAAGLLRSARAEKERAGARGDAVELTAELAETLVRAGQAPEAIALLRAAIAGAPRETALLYALGAAYERAGEPDAAVAQMRAILALQPDHAEALNFVAYSFAERGVRLEEAEVLARRALAQRPRSAHVLDSLGWILLRRGELARAVEVLEEAAALGSPDPTVLDHLGDAYRALARHDEAARAYRRALGAEDDEGGAEALRRRSSVERKLRELAERDGLPEVSLTPPASRR